MPIYTYNNRNILFIHIPKCGGSSFSREMSRIGMKEYLTIRGHNFTKINFLSCTPQHYDAEKLKKVLDFSNINQILILVRNPFQRLKSEYYWQLQNNIEKGSKSPAEWVEMMFREYSENNNVYDNHIRPQIDFIKGFNSANIIKLENDGLRHAVNAVRASFEISPTQYLFKSFVSAKIHDKKSKRIKKIEEAFDLIKSEIEFFYKDDYKFLGYKYD